MLIIVESPAKAKTIAKIVGSKYVVKASVGHIRRITDDSKTKDGRKLEINGIDIENDFQPIYEVDADKTKVVNEIKAIAKKEKDILFASDSDREGEAISWHLAEILGIKDMSTVRRLEFHEITKKAIDEAIKNPRPLNVDLVEAQRARQVLDKLVGYKLSPVLWSAMSNYKLSAGRVQSPALRILCDREKEILNFVPKEYWTIRGVFNNKDLGITHPSFGKEFAVIVDSKSEKKSEIKKSLDNNTLALELKYLQGVKIPDVIPDHNQAVSALKSLEQNPLFDITDVKIGPESNYTKPPFITSTLQQAASSKLGLNPKLTMQLAQKLYEGIDIDGNPTGLITYMRTDSVNLSQESIQGARDYISKTFSQYLPEKPKFYKSKSKNAQEAHEAIRPTDPLRTPAMLKGKLDSKLLALYEIIWKQTIACQMTDEKRERVSFELENKPKDKFKGSVAWTTHLGFKALWGNEIEDLSHWKKVFIVGKSFDLEQVVAMQDFTQPPNRYSAATLVKKLEELGIGRPSTYASIISTLQDRGYVLDGKGSMQPTNLGMKVNDLLSDNFANVTGAELTAKMEEDLDDIAAGEKNYLSVVRPFWEQLKLQVETKFGEIKLNAQDYRTSETDTKCFTCGSKMTQKLGRFGEYYQCENVKEHMFPLNYLEYKEALGKAQEEFNPQVKGRACEVCKKELIVRVSKASLKSYIACPDYKVGNGHTVTDITYGDCPKCKEEGRKGKKAGKLVLKSSKKFGQAKSFLACNLPIKECGFILKEEKKEKGEE
jgi:DNA topoisomerase I